MPLLLRAAIRIMSDDKNDGECLVYYLQNS